MSALNRPAQRFLRAYEGLFPQAEAAAALAREAVDRVVRDTGTFVHVIGARAKAPGSLRGKLRRKSYRNPDQQLTDIIGVRVITYYRDSVDPIVTRLREAFEINAKATTDKRLALGLRDFGYRSVHLIARLKATQILTPAHSLLRKRWFEIQVRSILEHAWAEIEHEIVYKSGISYPGNVLRRFAGLAGTLEMLDTEFLALREERNRLIEEYVSVYQRHKQQTKLFDVARLMGFLESNRPDALSWRRASNEGAPFATGLDVSCVEALRSVGLGTAASLRTLFRTTRFRYAVRSFATSQGIAPDQVSHLALVVLAVVTKNAVTAQVHFPELIFDPAIALMIRKRSRMRKRIRRR